jgi:hypothetical protein
MEYAWSPGSQSNRKLPKYFIQSANKSLYLASTTARFRVLVETGVSVF